MVMKLICMNGENVWAKDVGVICRIFVKSPKPQNPPKNGCRRATPTTQPVRQPTKSQKISKPSQYIMTMIYTYPLLTQVSQISTYRVQYMHQIKKKEPHGPPWVGGGLYSDVTLSVLGSTWQKSQKPCCIQTQKVWTWACRVGPWGYLRPSFLKKSQGLVVHEVHSDRHIRMVSTERER